MSTKAWAIAYPDGSIRLDSVSANELDAWRRFIANFWDGTRTLAERDGYQAIEVEIRPAAGKEAEDERYRWLIDHMVHQQFGPNTGWTLDVLLPGDNPESAIDAAMGKGEK